ncbi:MAG: metal ABC transporter ATP-binding protein [Anaerolineales bacterium]|nr:metal ABC transporter ATP-binding protein [Anaerolineales bacterium]
MTHRPLTIVTRHVEHEARAPILEVRDLTVRYNAHTALDGVSFVLDRGERIAVVGPNGAGKSTLFRVIAGVLPFSRGQVYVAGHCPGGHICIAYVPQRSQVDLTFPVTVTDVVMMGRAGRIGLFRRPSRIDRDSVHQALDVVGLLDQAGRQVSELSGGQQQRMFIARALAQEAELVLMDEPLTGLDVPAQEEVMRVLTGLQARGVTVMVATHDLNQAAERFDRVLLLNGRLIGIGNPGEVFTPERLQEAYGGHLRLIPTANGLMALSDTCCGGDD